MPREQREQIVDFAKIGISDNFCNGGRIGPKLVKLTGQKAKGGWAKLTIHNY